MLRLFSSFLPTTLLTTLWYLVVTIANRRTAFFTVFLGLCPSVFMVSLSFTPAATLAIVFFLVGICYVYKNNILSAALAFGLISYTHTGVAVIGGIFLILLFFTGPISRKKTLLILSVSLIIGLPWYIHVIKNMAYAKWNIEEAMPISIYPIITAFFMFGIYKGIRSVKRYWPFFLFLVSLLFIGPTYPFRLLCSQGMAGILIFAGIGLEGFYETIDKRIRKMNYPKKYPLFFFIVLLGYLLFIAPSINFYKYKERPRVNFKISDSFPNYIFQASSNSLDYPLTLSMFDKDLFESLDASIKRYTTKGEFIWTNSRHMEGLLWAMTERPSLSRMLRETDAFVKAKNISNASLLLIIDEPKGEFRRIYNEVKANFIVVEKIIKQDSEIYILKNKSPTSIPTYKIASPVVAFPIGICLLAVYSVFMVFLKRYPI
jgi:hypothetical protein